MGSNTVKESAVKTASAPPEKASATSVKLPAALKERIDDAAQKEGLSAHAFMVKTLAEATERSRLREQFANDAEQALREVEDSGLAYPLNDVQTYFAARARRKPTAARAQTLAWRPAHMSRKTSLKTHPETLGTQAKQDRAGASVDIAQAAFQDLERLEDFLEDNNEPMAGYLLPFILGALAILSLQPGIGRPVEGQKRELIIHRGRSGYLARYHYPRDVPHVTVLCIRHQRAAGYTPEEI